MSVVAAIIISLLFMILLIEGVYFSIFGPNKKAGYVCLIVSLFQLDLALYYDVSVTLWMNLIGLPITGFVLYRLVRRRRTSSSQEA